MLTIKEMKPAVFHDFCQFARLNSRAIRRIIEKVDRSTLAAALKNSDRGIRENFLYNTSSVAAKEVRQEMSYCFSSEESQEAKALITETANRLFDARKISERPARHSRRRTISTRPIKRELVYKAELKKCLEQKRVSQMSAEELAPFFVILSEMARNEGILCLESVASGNEKVDDTFIKKALFLIIDGTDPALLKEILNNYKKTALTELERRLDLIIFAIMGIQESDPTRLIHTRCDSVLAGKGVSGFNAP